jgi:Carboxypeptidase regulatory-like domain
MNGEGVAASLGGSVSYKRMMRVVVAVGFGLLLLGFPLFSQVNTGRILGTVTDQSGGVIAGAMVTVTNSQTGVARNLLADDAGEYNAPNLIPGTYTVRVTANGFQAFERQNILLETGKDDRVDAQLTPGQVTQTITVSESAPLLDTTSATVTGTLSTATIADLPVQGRNYQNLLQLRPGVTTRPGGGTLTTSTNGLRAEDNNYYVEGLDNDEPFTGQSIINSTLPVGDAATFVPIDAIQEVNVQTNTPAEFGKRPGADKFNSAEYTSSPSLKAPAELEQWGGTVGGPIVKDKLFYYAAFERQTYNISGNYPVQVPTSANTGDATLSIPAAISDLNTQCGNIKPTPSFCGPGGTFTVNNINPLTAKLLPLYGPNQASNQSYGFPNVVSINNVLGKIDYHLSDHHTIAGSYFFGNGSTIAQSETGPGITQPYFRDNAGLRAQFVTTSWTWTPNSTWVNDVRFGWNFHHRFDHVDDIGTALSTYGINTGITNPVLGGFPTVQVAAFSQLGGDPNLPKSYGPTNDYDLVDHVSFLRGKHAFKFGVETLFMRPFFGNYSKGRGTFNFTTGDNAFCLTVVKGTCTNGSTPLEDFLIGVADSGQGGTVLNGSPLRHLRQEDYSGFFEDSWHVKPHVTLNYGLRYEYFTPLADSNNQIGGWDPTIGLFQVGVNVNTPYNPYHKDFSPRLGLAWDVGGKGKTVIRVGGGVYYVDLVVGAMVDNISLPGRPSGITSIPTAYSTGANGKAAPLLPLTSGGIGTSSLNFSGCLPGTCTASNLNWTLAGPVFPAGQVGSSSGFTCGDGLGTDPAPCSVYTMARNIVPPRVETYTFGIQRTLSSNYTLEVNYIGDYSNNLAANRDVNAFNPLNPAEIACGHCELQSNRPYYAQFPYLQYINVMSNLDVSNYNALQTTFTARGYHGLGFTAAYTYSHALDDASSNRNQNVPQDNLNGAADYGPSNFDQRHHFSLTLNYAIPGRKGYGQMLEGWSINSAVLIQSGLPWDPNDKRDISKNGDKVSTGRWDFFGNPSDFKASTNPIPFFKPTPKGGLPNPTDPTYATYAVNNPACVADATTIGTQAAGGNLAKFGCFVQGNSVLIAPPTGTFGTASRNLFRDAGFRDWDFSLFKNWTVKERLTAQFRVEVFNILNHTILASPGSGGLTGDGTLGLSANTPDAAGQNPLLGTGAAREIQLGLKLLF